MIQTNNINGRDDWYKAIAHVGSRTYVEFETTRQAAFMAVARQLAVAGYLIF